MPGKGVNRSPAMPPDPDFTLSRATLAALPPDGPKRPPEAVLGVPDGSGTSPEASLGSPDGAQGTPGTGFGLPEGAAGCRGTGLGLPEGAKGSPEGSWPSPEGWTGLPEVPGERWRVPARRLWSPFLPFHSPIARGRRPEPTAGLHHHLRRLISTPSHARLLASDPPALQSNRLRVGLECDL